LISGNGTAWENLDIVPSEVECAARKSICREWEKLFAAAGLALEPIKAAEGTADPVWIVPPIGHSDVKTFLRLPIGCWSPLQCEYYALEGISMINKVLAQIRESVIPISHCLAWL